MSVISYSKSQVFLDGEYQESGGVAQPTPVDFDVYPNGNLTPEGIALVQESFRESQMLSFDEDDWPAYGIEPLEYRRRFWYYSRTNVYGILALDCWILN